jgi:hypothetical protein
MNDPHSLRSNGLTLFTLIACGFIVFVFTFLNRIHDEPLKHLAVLLFFAGGLITSFFIWSLCIVIRRIAGKEPSYEKTAFGKQALILTILYVATVVTYSIYLDLTKVIVR